MLLSTSFVGVKRSVSLHFQASDHLLGYVVNLVKTFKLSRDKQFLEKLTDVVGLYLNPPDKALVLCVDEKSQIQALDRTQPGLPIKKGRCGTRTHDYKRHGTTRNVSMSLGHLPWAFSVEPRLSTS